MTTLRMTMMTHTSSKRLLDDGNKVFRVRWLGYDESFDTWHPVDAINHLEAFTHWLQQHPEDEPRTEGSTVAAVHSHTTAHSAAAYSALTTQSASPLASQEPIVVPMTVRAALTSKHASQWRQAIADEIDAFYENGTWEEIDPSLLPEGKKPLTMKVVFSIKKRDDGRVERFKARICARGFKQIPGLDFDETKTYAPTISRVSLRVFLAVAAARNQHVRMLDFKNAFLNSDLHEQIFVTMPTELTDYNGRVFQLKKAAYGLVQAAARWWETLSEAAAELDLHPTSVDPCLFLNGDKSIALICHVDDILLAGASEHQINTFKAGLSSRFKARDVGEDSQLTYVALRVSRFEGRLQLDQTKFISETINQFGMSNAYPAKTPLPAGWSPKVASDPETSGVS
eukprot:m.268492 g.268492  ORF g.268492 m.268492 type:complete len:398 (+) comp11077_c3_seq7:374-1567(+)